MFLFSNINFHHIILDEIKNTEITKSKFNLHKNDYYYFITMLYNYLAQCILWDKMGQKTKIILIYVFWFLKSNLKNNMTYYSDYYGTVLFAGFFNGTNFEKTIWFNP